MRSVALSASFVLAPALASRAESTACPSGQALDLQGVPVAGLAVLWQTQDQPAQTQTGPDGRFSFLCADPQHASGTIEIRSSVYRADPVPVSPGVTVVLRLRPSVATEVTVVSTRSSLDLLPAPTSQQTLSAVQLQEFPALTLDERLRQVAGFELFRRTSSWAANPTSEGISLLGLGATAAGRTLVLLDGAPLNDGFGGWVHWNELPQDAVAGVEVAKGGSSDLYGSSALSGVVDLLPVRPEQARFDLGASGASLDTSDLHGRLDLRRHQWAGSAAAEGFRTGGYRPIAPSLQGPVDRPANVHSQAGRLDLEHSNPVSSGNRLFLTGNVLNEARNNGTILQTNGTRLWRWLAGDEWTGSPRLTSRVRLFGSEERYRQTFSSINTSRTSETLTRIQRPVTQEFGFTADTALHLGSAGFVVGTDLRDLRANDVEQPTVGPQAGQFQSTSARQRFIGGFAEGLLAWHGWAGAASLRVDSSARLDPVQHTFSAGGRPLSTGSFPSGSEILYDPRLGLSRTLPHGLLLDLGAFRSFRAPTLNELYRQGQVGQEITLANPQLRSERATGAQGGLQWATSGSRLFMQSSYFWTEVNRPVTALLLTVTPSTITNRRENLGQIQSQGLQLRSVVRLVNSVSLNAGYQYAHAVTTSYRPNPALVGTWIPNVPRHSVTMQLRAAPPWAEFTLAGRASGQAFDDSSNLYPLHRFFALDAFASRRFGAFRLFASAQNLLDQRMEVARTPQLTLGNPRIVQGGIEYHWPRSATN